MNRKIFFLLIALLIFINTIIYILFSGVDNVKIFIKWIPAFLLFIQTCCLVSYYKIKNDPMTTEYCLILMCAFIFCAGGDSCLIYSQLGIFVMGMILFIIAHALFGISRLKSINKYFRSEHKCKTIIGVSIISLIGILVLACIAYLAYYNHQYNNIVLMISVIIYSLFAIFSVISNYIYLLIYNNREAWFSFIGILLLAVSDIMMALYIIQYTNIYFDIFGTILYWCALTILGFSTYKNHEYVLLEIN